MEVSACAYLDKLQSCEFLMSIFPYILFIPTLVITIFLCCIKRRWISSEGKIRHAVGMAINWRMPFVLGAGLALFIIFHNGMRNILGTKWLYFVILCIFIYFILYYSARFIRVFKFDSRYEKDAYNHNFLSLVLMSIGVVIVYVVIFFRINEQTFLPFGMFAAVMGWIFQDSIKGIVAYYHLRSNGLLHIGDRIEIASHNIDGVIVDISLVTVTIRNRDNTISNISISSLLTGSFKNKQEVLDNKTSGRRMFRSFVIDTRSILSVDMEDIIKLKQKMSILGEDTIVFDNLDNTSSGEVLNIYLFRMYIRHWLMNNKDVSRYPRLVVRLLEPTAEGIPMQLYAYIIKTDVVPFELIQSQITEHVILSMNWFGLRLYQRPSGEDICNKNNDD